MPRELLHADPQNRRKLLNDLRRNEGRLTRVLLQLRRKDGSLFYADADLRLLRDARGKEVGLEGFYRDVSDRMRVQKFLNEETHQLLPEGELFRRLLADAEFHLDYTASLGHQLLTPLSSLIETLRNFQRGVVSQQRLTERLPYVIGQAVVCARLVRNLSYMDKIVRGEEFRRQRVSLAKLAIETKLDFLHLLQEKRLDLVVDDVSLNRYLRVLGHREMLRQVLVNLVDNACKYSQTGSTILVGGKKLGQGAVLEISNVGLPLPKEDQERIFERGYRTRHAQAVIPHGTGLGLWLVRKILEAHDATVQCGEVFDVEAGQKRVQFRIYFPQEVLAR